jgi:signal transduction histidine kinase
MFSLMVMHVFPDLRGRGSLGVLATGVALMATGISVLLLSLRPFRRLREKLTTVRVGEEGRIDGEYPSEVQPLIDNLNALLEAREKAVQRAIATAGDLAHGLKTPLALLAQEADRAEAAGHPEFAANVTQQVERMSRQVTYHLARARAAASGASGTSRCELAVCADALVRALSKLYADRALNISSRISQELFARVQREDLDEMLGNLMDNACKWANSRVLLEATEIAETLVLTIDDDGPGLERALRAAVMERGVRLDEATPGSGLGLAIVRDLAELYGGSIFLNDSPLGGLRVQISLPAS